MCNKNVDIKFRSHDVSGITFIMYTQETKGLNRINWNRLRSPMPVVRNH